MRFIIRPWFTAAPALLLMITAACSNSPSLPLAAPSQAAATAQTANAAAPLTAPHSPKTPLPSEIADAFARTRNVRNVRYEITSRVTLTQDKQTTQQPGLVAHGAESGDNRQLALSGIVNAAGQAATFEFITLGGVTYVKGLNGIPGVNPAQWYRFPKELGNVTHDAPGVKTLLAQLEAQDIQNAEFSSAGFESIDGQVCAIWLARNPELARGLLGIAGSAQATAQLGALDQGEFRVWTCADGYMHRIIGVVEGHDPSNPSHQATVQLTVHLYDLDAEIPITAPPDAQDFQVPVTGESETPTPTQE